MRPTLLTLALCGCVWGLPPEIPVESDADTDADADSDADADTDTDSDADTDVPLVLDGPLRLEGDPCDIVHVRGTLLEPLPEAVEVSVTLRPTPVGLTDLLTWELGTDGAFDVALPALEWPCVNGCVYELSLGVRDGRVLGPLQVAPTWDLPAAGHLDVDGDGHGAGPLVVECIVSPSDDDCDDDDADVHPGAVDVCDGRDGDCNGSIDDGPPFRIDGEGPGLTDLPSPLPEGTIEVCGQAGVVSGTVDGATVLTAGPGQTDARVQAALDVTGSLGVSGLRVDGTNTAPVLAVEDGATVVLEDVDVACAVASTSVGMDVWGTVDMRGGSIRFCETPGPGGAIRVRPGGHVTLGTPGVPDDGVAIEDNGSLTSGGGVYVGTTDPMLPTARLTMYGGVLRGNESSGDGAGLAVWNSAEAYLEDVRVEANESLDGAGGGIRCNGGLLTLEGGEILGNTAGVFGGGLSAANGILQVDGTDIRANHAGQSGGGVLIGNAMHLATLRNVWIEGNSAGTHNGGGLRTTSSLLLEDSIVEGNSCPASGGGLDLSGGSTVTLRRVQVRGNAGLSGGGVFAGQSTVALEDVTVAENVAGGNGGGVHVTAISALDLAGDVDLHDNIAVYGGGLWTRVSPTGTGLLSVVRNHAAGDGGGIRAAVDGDFALVSAFTVQGNRADSGHVAGDDLDLPGVSDGDGDGGGLWISASGRVDLAHFTVADNSGFAGGGLYVDTTGAAVFLGDVSGNHAAGEGGAAYVDAGTLAVGGDWSDNEAPAGSVLFTG
ncbi:MAG: putative metal-binding motif-containing protein, partial [Alphaproteobacteria bacterium]|nr:putative metal-binding motif-containing protein [Alphaproteobacteria bacterium]